jgi:hypothetical protein
MRTGVVGAALLAALASCAPSRTASEAGGAPGVASVAAEDTLRGTIAVVGSEPATMVALRPVGGGAEVLLEGEPVRELRTLSGVEVRLSGHAGPGERRFTVRSFSVRAVDGVPAVDGILVADGDALYLRLMGGELRRIAKAPAALRAQVGKRVWVAGALEGEVAAFGVVGEGYP